MEIKIFGKSFQVIEEKESKLTNQNVGEINHKTQEIFILDSLHDENKNDTLLHESIHSIDYQLSIGLDERQTTALTTGLLTLFKENGLDIDLFAKCQFPSTNNQKDVANTEN